MAKLEREAHRIAAQALGQQEQALTELRTRTGTLLTAASLIASFLGGQALARQGLSLWIVLALAAPETYDALYVIREDPGEVDRRLAYWLQAFREGNHPTVARLTKAFELAGFALLVEIAFLAVGLAVS